MSEKVKPQMESISERPVVMADNVGFHNRYWRDRPSKNFLWKTYRRGRIAVMRWVQRAAVSWCDVLGNRHTGDVK